MSSTFNAESGAVSTKLKFNALQMILIGIPAGLAALKAGEAATAFVTFIESALKVLQKVLWDVIRLAPIGTAGLIGYAVAHHGWATLGTLAWFVIAVYVGLIIVGGLVYPALLRLNGVSPLAFYKQAWPAIQLALVTRSSLGTLPLTTSITTEKLGVPHSYRAFATSLGPPLKWMVAQRFTQLSRLSS